MAKGAGAPDASNDDYPNTAGHRGDELSKAAAGAVNLNLNATRRTVLDAVKAAGSRGLTPDECAEVLQMPSRRVQPRFTELGRHMRLIVDSGQRRPTESGCMARVWIAAPEADGQADESRPTVTEAA